MGVRTSHPELDGDPFRLAELLERKRGPSKMHRPGILSSRCRDPRLVLAIGRDSEIDREVSEAQRAVLQREEVERSDAAEPVTRDRVAPLLQDPDRKSVV